MNGQARQKTILDSTEFIFMTSKSSIVMPSGDSMTGSDLSIKPQVAVGDMPSLRKAVKFTNHGSGEVCKAIENSRFKLTERGITMLIVACRRYGGWKKAMEIFEAMKGEKLRSRGIRPNLYTYSSLISVCCAAGECSQGLRVLEEMRLAGVKYPDSKPDMQVYRMLIALCHSHQRSQDVVNLYKMMKEDCAGDMAAAIAIDVVEACGAVGLWDQAFEILDLIAEYGWEVPLTTYCRLLHCCVRQDSVNSATDIFLAMQMWGVVPDGIACYHMAQVFSAVPDPQMCLELINSMETAGIAVSDPTLRCVNAALHSCGLPQVEKKSKIHEKGEKCCIPRDSSGHALTMVLNGVPE